jgi:hypothetical protein
MRIPPCVLHTLLDVPLEGDDNTGVVLNLVPSASLNKRGCLGDIELVSLGKERNSKPLESPRHSGYCYNIVIAADPPQETAYCVR